jgi:hypothetical protein
MLVLDAGQLAAYITDDGNLTNQQVQQGLPTLPPDEFDALLALSRQRLTCINSRASQGVSLP